MLFHNWIKLVFPFREEKKHNKTSESERKYVVEMFFFWSRVEHIDNMKTLLTLILFWRRYACPKKYFSRLSYAVVLHGTFILVLLWLSEKHQTRQTIPWMNFFSFFFFSGKEQISENVIDTIKVEFSFFSSSFLTSALVYTRLSLN